MPTYSPHSKIKLPEDVAAEISRRAAQLARLRAPKRTGAGAKAIRPSRRKGVVGVYIPPSAGYMLYQNYGVKPYLMTHLEGKTIPIRQANGEIAFRRVKDVGKVIYPRDERGRFTGPPRIAWRHPGIKAKYFIETSIEQAVDEWRERHTQKSIVDILRRSPDSELAMRLIEKRGSNVSSRRQASTSRRTA